MTARPGAGAVRTPPIQAPSVQAPSVQAPSIRLPAVRPSPRPKPPARRSGAMLFAQAQGVLGEARRELSSDERYRLAHLAALRFAAALFAERAQPSGRRHRGPVNAWVLLVSMAPDLGEWAAFFAAGAPTRAALEAGAFDVVSSREGGRPGAGGRTVLRHRRRFAGPTRGATGQLSARVGLPSSGVGFIVASVATPAAHRMTSARQACALAVVADRARRSRRAHRS